MVVLAISCGADRLVLPQGRNSSAAEVDDRDGQRTASFIDYHSWTNSGSARRRG